MTEKTPPDASRDDGGFTGDLQQLLGQPRRVDLQCPKCGAAFACVAYEREDTTAWECDVCNGMCSTCTSDMRYGVCPRCSPRDDDADCICASCNGSGEGAFDGSRCGECSGSGNDRSPFGPRGRGELDAELDVDVATHADHF